MVVWGQMKKSTIYLCQCAPSAVLTRLSLSSSLSLSLSLSLALSQSDDLAKRLEILKEHFTYSLYVDSLLSFAINTVVSFRLLSLIITLNLSLIHDNFTNQVQERLPLAVRERQASLLVPPLHQSAAGETVFMSFCNYELAFPMS